MENRQGNHSRVPSAAVLYISIVRSLLSNHIASIPIENQTAEVCVSARSLLFT